MYIQFTVFAIFLERIVNDSLPKVILANISTTYKILPFVTSVDVELRSDILTLTPHVPTHGGTRILYICSYCYTVFLDFRKTGVKGLIYGTDRNTVLVTQHAALIEILTGKETLIFAASIKLPKATCREREYAVSQ